MLQDVTSTCVFPVALSLGGHLVSTQPTKLDFQQPQNHHKARGPMALLSFRLGRP